MVTLIVNGETINTSADSDLLSFLRNDLGIKSVKDGCSEGACGTCKVLIDGAARNACTQKVQKLDGKTITTVDGFSQYEKDVITSYSIHYTKLYDFVVVMREPSSKVILSNSLGGRSVVCSTSL